MRYCDPSYLVRWFVGSSTSGHRVHWLVGWRQVGDRHRSDVAGAWL